MSQSKDRRDYYYYKAKAEGYRARSAYKLLDIENEYSLFSQAERIVDLCAAPGSWSQALANYTKAKIVAVDIQDMAPIDGVTILKGDITSEECVRCIFEVFGGEKADLIVCDGAPDVTGFHDLDEFLQMDLLKASLYICTRLLNEGCRFVGKCFRGEYTGYVISHFMKFFEKVQLVKPKASRNVSVECFLLCFGFKNVQHNPFEINTDEKIANVNVVGCGSGPDPDFRNENIEKKLSPICPPINPPYE